MKEKANYRKATEALIRALGKEKVIVAGERKFMASFDSSKLSFPYDALVQVRKDLM